MLCKPAGISGSTAGAAGACCAGFDCCCGVCAGVSVTAKRCFSAASRISSISSSFSVIAKKLRSAKINTSGKRNAKN